jgi:hypothetical protein
MLASAILSYIIFPDMLQMGTQGERGGQFVSMVYEYSKTPLKLLKQQLPLFITSFFKNTEIFLIVLVISLLVQKKYLSKNNNQLLKKYLGFFVILFFTYGILVAMVMPNMTSYKIRYFSPIISLYFVIFTILYSNLCDELKLNKFISCVILLIITGVVAYKEANNFNNPFYFNGTVNSRKAEKVVKDADIWWGLGGGASHSWIIHHYVDKLATSRKVWTLVDFEHEGFLKFAKEGKEAKRYAYLMMPKTQEQAPTGGEEWVIKTTQRQAYYMFTLKSEKTAAMAFETSIYLVCPY